MRTKLALLVTAGSLMFAETANAQSSIPGSVLSNSRVAYSTIVDAGMTCCLTVRGDGDTDLDLYIFDQFGNLVAKDDDDTDQCVVSWTARNTARFTILIVNRGAVFNRFTMSRFSL